MSISTTPRAERAEVSRDRPAENAQPQSDASGSTRRTHAWVALGLCITLSLFAARCVRTAWNDSITSDESTHLIHCLNYWTTGDDLEMWELGAPRLPHIVNALASFKALEGRGFFAPATDRETHATEIAELVYSGNNRVLVPARFVAILAGVCLLGAIFWAVARQHGALLALIATFLISLVPEILAHSSIAGSDIPFTAAAFLSMILLARYAERPTWGRWIGVGLGIGLAWAMRHTALLLLPMAAGTFLLVRWRRENPRKPIEILDTFVRCGFASMVVTAIAFGILWAGDGLGTLTLSDFSERAMTLDVPKQVGPIDLSSVPLPTSLLSILKQVRHQSHGHEAFLCGEFRTQGWPLYFPIAFLLKTPGGFLALLILAAVLVRPKGAFDMIVLVFLALLWIMLIRNKVNIGVRYALLTYPLSIIFIARLFEPRRLRDRVWGPLTIAAVFWLAFASYSSEGKFLSYFNEFGGGPSRGWLYLADSNIDWGQDQDRLAAALPQLGIDEITVDVSSNRPLEVRGVRAVQNPSRAFQVPSVTPPNRRLYDSDGNYLPVYTRYVAVSVSRLLGLYSQNDMSWLRTRKLVARIGDSLFVFDLDHPADRPFFE